MCMWKHVFHSSSVIATCIYVCTAYEHNYKEFLVVQRECKKFIQQVFKALSLASLKLTLHMIHMRRHSPIHAWWRRSWKKGGSG